MTSCVKYKNGELIMACPPLESAMLNRLSTLLRRGFVLLGLIGFCPRVVSAQSARAHHLHGQDFLARETHSRGGRGVPATGRESVELMMPIWSPGYYRVEDYAKQLTTCRRGDQMGRHSTSQHTKQPVANSRPPVARR